MPFAPRTVLPALAVAAGLVFGPAAAGAQALTPEQGKAVSDLVRETLIRNPEIIQEALIELERRNQVAQAEAQSKAVLAESARLSDPASSVILGNPQGDVTLVEFMDYNCGFCRRAMEDVRVLMKADPRLRVVIKDLPMLGPDSVEASRVALAVKNQLQGEKYLDFHVRLMSVRGRVNGAKALEVAKQAGADPERVRKEMESAPVKAMIADTAALADRLGLTGTPAFILGDEVVFGAVGAEALKGRIESLRNCGKTQCSG